MIRLVSIEVPTCPPSENFAAVKSFHMVRNEMKRVAAQFVIPDPRPLSGKGEAFGRMLAQIRDKAVDLRQNRHNTSTISVESAYQGYYFSRILLLSVCYFQLQRDVIRTRPCRAPLAYAREVIIKIRDSY